MNYNMGLWAGWGTRTRAPERGWRASLGRVLTWKLEAEAQVVLGVKSKILIIDQNKPKGQPGQMRSRWRKTRNRVGRQEPGTSLYLKAGKQRKMKTGHRWSKPVPARLARNETSGMKQPGFSTGMNEENQNTPQGRSAEGKRNWGVWASS